MALPKTLKSIQPFIKVANDLRKNHNVVAYYCDLHAMQTGMKIDMSSPDAKKYLIKLMTSLEEQKSQLAQDPEKKEQITSELVGQALIEEQARKLFVWSDGKDRNSEFGKNVVKAFYTAAILYDVAESVGGEDSLDAESQHQRKYARWKATYINSCLKNGEVPVPGPIGGIEDEFEAELKEALKDADGAEGGAAASAYTPQQPQVPPTQPLAPPSQPPVPATRAKVLPTHPPASSNPPATYTEPAYEPPNDQEWPPEVFNRAQKLCKFALSAITYQDVPAAMDNLSKCMQLLRTGKEN